MSNSKLSTSQKQIVVETIELELITLTTVVISSEKHETKMEIYELTRPGRTFTTAEVHLMRNAFDSHLIAIHEADVEIRVSNV